MRPALTIAAAVTALLCPASSAGAGAGADAEPESEQGARTVVNILDRAPLYSTPGGPPMAIGDHLLRERGSAWVVRRLGDWLGISTVERNRGRLGDWLGISTVERNRGRLAWIRQTPRRPLTTTRLLVVVDLSEHRVLVTLGGLPLMSAPVTIGAPRSPSPVTRTSVWRRVEVTPRSGYDRAAYGPVIIALRLWQDRPSPGRPNGGVMAFHGGGGFARGLARSGGCFRMRDVDAVRLARHVRPGTPVIIRR